jgi:hypothetical protein
MVYFPQTNTEYTLMLCLSKGRGNRGWMEPGMKLPWKQSIDPWEKPFCVYRSSSLGREEGTTNKMYEESLMTNLLIVLTLRMKATLLKSLVSLSN